jgi:hypothetical protein
MKRACPKLLSILLEPVPSPPRIGDSGEYYAIFVLVLAKQNLFVVTTSTIPNRGLSTNDSTNSEL